MSSSMDYSSLESTIMLDLSKILQDTLQDMQKSSETTWSSSAPSSQKKKLDQKKSQNKESRRSYTYEETINQLASALLPVYGEEQHELVGSYYKKPHLSERSDYYWEEPKITQDFNKGDWFSNYQFEFCTYSRQMEVAAF